MACHHAFDRELWTFSASSVCPSNLIRRCVVFEVSEFGEWKAQSTQRLSLLQIGAVLGKDCERVWPQLGEVELEKRHVKLRMNTNFYLKWSFAAVNEPVVDLNKNTVRVTMLTLKHPQLFPGLLVSRKLIPLSFKGIEFFEKPICGFELTGHVLAGQRPTVGIDEEESSRAWDYSGVAPDPCDRMNRTGKTGGRFDATNKQCLCASNRWSAKAAEIHGQ